jgi:hypothetical protein
LLALIVAPRPLAGAEARGGEAHELGPEQQFHH